MNGKRIALILLILLPGFLTGCAEKPPTYLEREQRGEVPQVLMDTPADKEELPLDVAALVHDLQHQFSRLEKSLSGESPEMKEMLLPAEQSLQDIRNTLDEMDPLLKESRKTLQDIRESLDTLREQIQE